MMTPNLSTRNPTRSTPGQLDSTRNLAPTRLSLSVAPHSRGLRLELRLVPAPKTPHLPDLTTRDSVCSVLFSIDSNKSISVDFFSTRY